MKTLFDELIARSYPGRGIFMGRTRGKAVLAYFIMGRSENSRNRIFVEDGDGIRTKAFDEAKVSDPSLIIYAPVRVLGNKTIVTNGDQTDTVYDALDKQMTFEQSLRSRTYEPDAPNYTPRISGVMRLGEGRCNYALSIIKRNGTGVARNMFAYEDAETGEGRLIHTYWEQAGGKDDALPPFEGEPVRLAIPESEGESIDSFASALWQSLNAANRVSLWVRYIDIASGSFDSRIVNKNIAGK